MMSKRSSTVRFFVLAVAALALALALPRRAFAGTLQIQDEAHILKAGDAERLRSVVAEAPFDARLVFTTDYADPQDLSRFVGSRVNEPNLISVGVDPQHRHVQAHFGRGSGIAPAAWPAIERAGNGAFHDGDWAGGAAAIFRTASQSVTAASPGYAQRTAEPAGIGSGLLLLVLVGGGIVAIAFFAWRRSRYGMAEGPGYGGRPYGGAPYGVQPSSGGIGPLGGGLIGAGLGGLAGYELGKLEGERDAREPRFDDRSVGSDDDYDAGGGGSSWDAGGDGGGGGGDGGGDTGGGGSDF